MSRQKIKAFLSLSNSEMKGGITLLAAILVVVIINLTLPLWIKNKAIYNKDFEQDVAQLKNALNNSAVAKKNTYSEKSAITSPALFYFDPNTASEEELKELGLSERVVYTLIKYRNAGGSFEVKKDILRVYGFSKKEFEKLEAFILLPDEKNEKKTEDGKTIVGEKKWNKEDKKVIIDLNKATASELQQIEGIGSAYSERIIKYRNLLGGFYEVSQLQEVYGLSDETIQNIADFLVIDTTKLQKINLNTVSSPNDVYHVYLTDNQQNDLYTYIKTMGGIKSMEELLKNNIIDKATAEKIKPYLQIY